MKERIWLLPVALIVFLTTALLTVILIRLQNPFAVFPRFHVPYMAFFSLLALLAEHYLAPGRDRPWLTAAIPATLAFGLLPWAAALATPEQALRPGAAGGVVFCVCAFSFRSLQRRWARDPSALLAPAVGALGLFLASQAFASLL